VQFSDRIVNKSSRLQFFTQKNAGDTGIFCFCASKDMTGTAVAQLFGSGSRLGCYTSSTTWPLPKSEAIQEKACAKGRARRLFLFWSLSDRDICGKFFPV